MLLLVGIPQTLQKHLATYRSIFCREAGFAHVARCLTGLLLSSNKTLQGIYYQWTWPESERVARQAMHAGVFESAGWSPEALMHRNRQVVARAHRGWGRAVLSLDWTFAHHPYSEKIYGAKGAYDYVTRCWSRYQTVVTAAIANSYRKDGVAVEMHVPNYQQEKLAYLAMNAQASYTQMEQVHQRLEKLLHYRKNRLVYRKRIEMVVDIVHQLEAEGNFPKADYAFDCGLLSRSLTEVIKASGQHWVSEIECSRLIIRKGQWQRTDGVAQQLREEHPESVVPKVVTCRNDEQRAIWAFSKTVRLKKYGRKRLVTVYETTDLGDAPRFLLTDALHWDSARTFATWSYRWPIKTFHGFAKQVVGFELAQLRNEEAVKCYFTLSCVALSLLQATPGSGQSSERFEFAQHHKPTIGQRLYTLVREALQRFLKIIQGLLAQAQSIAQILEVLMPA